MPSEGAFRDGTFSEIRSVRIGTGRFRKFDRFVSGHRSVSVVDGTQGVCSIRECCDFVSTILNGDAIGNLIYVGKLL